MAFQYTDLAFKCDKVGGLAKLVLWIICEHANPKKGATAWPSLRTIAEEAGISVGSAFNATNELEKLGIVTVARTKIKTKAGNERSAVNVYKLTDAFLGVQTVREGYSQDEQGVHHVNRGSSPIEQGCSSGDTGCSRGDTENVIQPVTEPVIFENAMESENINNNTVVDVVSNPPSHEEKKPGLVAGYTPEEIQAHVAKFPRRSWVYVNATKDALTRPGFVKHVMGLEPPRKAVVPGSHAERNPELHTGLDAAGKPYSDGAMKFCSTPGCNELHVNGVHPNPAYGIGTGGRDFIGAKLRQQAEEEDGPKNPNCDRCHGPTYGNPTWEYVAGKNRPYCADCMKLPAYRRESGQRAILTPDALAASGPAHAPESKTNGKTQEATSVPAKTKMQLFPDAEPDAVPEPPKRLKQGDAGYLASLLEEG